MQHNGRDPENQPILYRTYSRRDVQGRVVDVTDARQNVTISYRYDLTGRMAYQHSLDGGRRWQLADIIDQPLRSWDDRGHELAFSYDDPLHRPTATLFHGELSANQLFHMRPAPGYADFTTPIRGLYQASSTTHGGGGVTGIPALQVVRKLKKVL